MSKAKLPVKADKAGLQLVIRHMIRVVGKSFAEVSRAIGRNSRYIPTMLKDATTPGLDLFVKIANACGYDVLLVGHGEAHRLAAERIGEAKVSATRLWSVESAQVEGAGTCKVEVLNTGDCAGYECSEYIMHCNACGHEFGHVLYNEDGDVWMSERPNFCPNCGARVVDEGGDAE